MGLLALLLSIPLGATSAAPPLAARGAAELPALSYALPAESATTAPVDAEPAVAPNVSGKYFGARHYGSKIGRFTSVDPYLDQQAALVSPQLWNRYAYGRNNPLRYVDPDGKHPILVVALVMAAAFVLNNPTNANVTQGPTQDTIVPNSLLVAAGYGFAAGGARAAGREIFEETFENVTGLPVGGLPAKPSEAYDRLKHYGRTPTKADRRVLGAQTDEVLDHDPPLVKRYYEGDPSCCEPPGYQMTTAERRASASDRGRMNRQPRTESNRQGGEMSQYSQEKKREISQ